MKAISLLFSTSTETLKKFCLQKPIQEHIKFCPIFEKKKKIETDNIAFIIEKSFQGTICFILLDMTKSNDLYRSFPVFIPPVSVT